MIRCIQDKKLHAGNQNSILLCVIQKGKVSMHRALVTYKGANARLRWSLCPSFICPRKVASPNISARHPISCLKSLIMGLVAINSHCSKGANSLVHSRERNGTLPIQIPMAKIAFDQIFTAVGRGWFSLHKWGSFVVASHITFIYFIRPGRMAWLWKESFGKNNLYL